MASTQLESQGGTLTGPVSLTGPIGLALNWTGADLNWPEVNWPIVSWHISNGTYRLAQ